MSFVSAASDDFLMEIKAQLRSGNVAGMERLYGRKLYKSIRKIKMKIGPSFIGPSMVGNAMMTLLNYYIAAAMW
ncbi:unnamed protein product [Orchesella dallaii]|uniref:Uncharacterized protein n=1 Tax=Orchesella dallaii TaxID=48710 RepID=A0ABP1PTK1_9HEXA